MQKNSSIKHRFIKQVSIEKYRLHKTSLNRNEENSGRRLTVHSEKNIGRVRNMLENNQRKNSASRNGMGLSAASFNKITHEKLRRYPYKVNIRQQ